MIIEQIKTCEIQSRAIDILRFPLAVMVVAIHTYFNESLNLRGTEIPFTGDWAHQIIFIFSIALTDCAVPLFFVISGYLYFLKTPNVTKDIYIDKTKKKLVSLMIPFLLWNVLSICISPSSFIGASLAEKVTGFWSLDFTIGISTGPWNGPLWFLRDLFIVMLFTPIIEWVLRKLGYWPFIIFILLQILHLSYLFPGFSATSFVFFSFGAWLAIKKPNFSQTLSREKRMVILIMGIIMLLVRYDTGNKISEVAWYINQIWIWCQMALYWVIALIIAEKTKSVTMWQKLAASGMVIYCMHRIINSKISAFGLLLLGKPEITGVEAVILYFITISLTVAICYSTHLFISKHKILSLLLEGTRNR
jgi:surface polysaccharide O-acyltransferase-like enzyme